MLHGGDIYSIYADKQIAPGALVDFSANISPLGIPDGVKQAIIDELDNARHYPDPNYRRLRAAIAGQWASAGLSAEVSTGTAHSGGLQSTSADRSGLLPEMICCGNGAADVIYRLVLARRPRRALIPAPTFVEYEEALQLAGTGLDVYDCPRETLGVAADILEAITPELDMMFLCNPNNPTGLMIDDGLMDEIIHKTRDCGVFLVVDECFLDFCEDEDLKTVVRKLSQNEHILVLKSFTKMYAIPGIRLGYGICSDLALIDRMVHCGQSWPVSTTAESAGIAALSEHDYKARVRRYIRQERDFLESDFRRLGITYFKSRANYMLIRVDASIRLYELLLEQGILIRRCANYRNLDGSYYRVAVNAHEDNVRLLDALHHVFEN